MAEFEQHEITLSREQLERLAADRPRGFLRLVEEAKIREEGDTVTFDGNHPMWQGLETAAKMSGKPVNPFTHYRSGDRVVRLIRKGTASNPIEPETRPPVVADSPPQAFRPTSQPAVKALAQLCGDCQEKTCSLPTTSCSGCWWKRVLKDPVKLEVAREAACEAARELLAKVPRPQRQVIPAEAYEICRSCPDLGVACPNGLCKTCGEAQEVVIRVPCLKGLWQFIADD